MSEINCEVLAAHLRADTADILACLPAIRRAAERNAADTACLDSITLAAYRMLRTAENLAAWDALQMPPAPNIFCVGSTAHGLFRAAALLCPQAQIVCLPTQKPLYTSGNARLFSIVLGNLLANSLLYAAEEPHIILTMEQQAQRAVFTLRDNGKGMRPETLGKALLPWVSQDPYADGAPAPGLGLGLTLAQQYARAYGGMCAVHSGFGEGCTLALSLPAVPAADAPADVNTDSAVVSAALLQNRYSILYTQLCDVCTLPQ